MISNFEISLSPPCQPSRPQIHHTVARAVKSRMKFQKDWMAWAAVERIVMKRGPTTASGPSQKQCYRFLSWSCKLIDTLYMMNWVRWDDDFPEWHAGKQPAGSTVKLFHPAMILAVLNLSTRCSILISIATF